DPVHLKNMLRQVQSDRSNLAHGWLPFAADSITAVWHSDAARGPSTPSFDHLVGADEYRRRNVEAKRLRGLEIDDEIELGGLHHRQIGRLRTFENPADVDAGLAIGVRKVRSIAHQTTACGVLPQIVDRGNRIARLQ